MVSKTCEQNKQNDFRARVREALEEYKPTKPGRTFGAGQTQEEFERALGEFKWCDALKVAVVPAGSTDCYNTMDSSWLADRASDFLEERHAWALAQADRVSSKADVDAYEIKRWAEYAKSCAKDNGSLTTRDKLVKSVVGSYANRIDIDVLDASPILLGTPQGALDIRHGQLLSDNEYHNDQEIGATAKRFYVTKCTNADMTSEYMGESFKYDKRWDKFINEIMCGDEERADYLQRALGYSIYGGNPEECMFIAYGATTRNGKNTLLDSVQNALGDYATSAERGFLLDSGKTGGADEALASLVGKRFVTISEPPKGKHLDESKVKSLCSCDYQSTSKKYGAQFQFKPQMTMWMSCNHLPEVSDDSVFASNRIRVIPFERHFDTNERDTGLKDRFATESGKYTVLAWLLRGYGMYKQRGLEEPKSIKRATSLYNEVGGSTVDRFLRECCIVGVNHECDNNAFKEAYKIFCENVLNEDALRAKKLNEELRQYGIKTRPSNGRTIRTGVKLAVPDSVSELLESVKNEPLSSVSKSTEGLSKTTRKGFKTSG